MKKVFKTIGVIFTLILAVAIIAFFIIANGDFKNSAEALIHGKAPLSLFYGKANKGSADGDFAGVIEKVEKDYIVVKTQNGESKKVNLYLTVKIKNQQGVEDIVQKVPMVVYIAEKERLGMVKMGDEEKRFKLLEVGQAVFIEIRDDVGIIKINESVYTGK